MLHVDPVLDAATRSTFVLFCIGGFFALIMFVLKQVPDPDSSPTLEVMKQLQDAHASGADAKVMNEALAGVAKRIGLPLQQVKTYWETFKRWDKSGNGSVDANELKQMLIATIGFCPPDSEVEAIIRNVDADGNGTVEFNEFCTLVKQIDLGEQTDEELRDAFLLWSEGQQRISREEMHKALTTLGDKLSDEEFVEFMKEADTDNSGTIDLREYKRALTWGRGDAS